MTDVDPTAEDPGSDEAEASEPDEQAGDVSAFEDPEGDSGFGNQLPGFDVVEDRLRRAGATTEEVDEAKADWRTATAADREHIVRNMQAQDDATIIEGLAARLEARREAGNAADEEAPAADSPTVEGDPEVVPADSPEEASEGSQSPVEPVEGAPAAEGENTAPAASDG